VRTFDMPAEVGVDLEEKARTVAGPRHIQPAAVQVAVRIAGIEPAVEAAEARIHIVRPEGPVPAVEAELGAGQEVGAAFVLQRVETRQPVLTVPMVLGKHSLA
jgi:hypothetical protein